MKNKSERSFWGLAALTSILALLVFGASTSQATDQEGMVLTREGTKSPANVLEGAPYEAGTIHNPAGSQMLVAGLTIIPNCDGYIDETGCAGTGGGCEDDLDCYIDFICSVNHCCPEGQVWSGTVAGGSCVEGGDEELACCG